MEYSWIVMMDSWSWVDSYGSFYSGWYFPNGKWFTLIRRLNSSHENGLSNFLAVHITLMKMLVTSSNWCPYQTEICPGLNLAARLSLDGLLLLAIKTWYFNPSSIDHAAYVRSDIVDLHSYGYSKNEWSCCFQMA